MIHLIDKEMQPIGVSCESFTCRFVHSMWRTNAYHQGKVKIHPSFNQYKRDEQDLLE